ncbi:mitochondrial import inner membrane translocase subunit Tim54 [Crassisporium funariophilum]|nr:mitochondrial import inner membrane translocase subunit Tim54 [Crassisporium funariophilum]
MTSPSAEKPPSLPARVSGVRTVLSYTGIPPSWLDKRPKVPSRNWLIFLSVTSSVIGLYVYDRRQCKQIRQAYVDKVKHLAELPMDPFDLPRKVTVYASKWPGDEDYDQSMKYFRKYVKPVLVAAAVDFEMIPGKRHGDIAKRIAEDVRLRRRFDLGLDPESEVTKMLPTYRPANVRRQRELEGGIVIVGRPTFKEFMVGLQRGWTDGLEKVDRDEDLARILEDDPHFDEPEEPIELGNESPSSRSQLPSHQSSPVFSPLQMHTQPPASQTPRDSSISKDMNHPPAVVPALPPLLLVPYTNHIGISQVPLMIWGFFNQRHKVRSGAEAGYRLVMKTTRPIDVPESFDHQSPEVDAVEGAAAPSKGDLDFDKPAEAYFKSSLNSLPEDTEKARKRYYEGLSTKLATARELARGTREPTKEELNNPPPTEVELRAERLKKERRWRDDLEGWEIIKPTSNVAWDERFQQALQLFIDPPQDDQEWDNSKTS